MKNRKNPPSLLTTLLAAVVLLLVSTSNAASQSSDPSNGDAGLFLESEYGAPQAMLAPDPPLAGSGVVHIGAEAFQAWSQSTTWTRNNTLMIYATSAGINYFDAPVTLPNGVKVNQIVFYFYDNDAVADVSFIWARLPSNSPSGAIISSSFSSGASDSVRYTVVPNPPGVIDNGSYNYLVRATLPGGANVALHSVRIEYGYDTALPAVRR